MMNEPFADLTGVRRLLQSIQHQVRLHGSAHATAHDAAGEHVDHAGEVHGAHPGGDVREVGDPQLIGPGGHELPMNAIQRSISGIRREGRAILAPTNHAAQPVSAHQPLDRAASDWNAFAVQLPPDFARTVDPEVLLPDAMDRAGELAIALHARRQA